MDRKDFVDILCEMVDVIIANSKDGVAFRNFVSDKENIRAYRIGFEDIWTRKNYLGIRLVIYVCGVMQPASFKFVSMAIAAKVKKELKKMDMVGDIIDISVKTIKRCDNISVYEEGG